MALAAGLFTPAAVSTRSIVPAEMQTRVRANRFKESSLRFRRSRNYSVYASQEGRTNALPLIVYMDWTAKLAQALHSGQRNQPLLKLSRVTRRPFAHFLNGVNRP